MLVHGDGLINSAINSLPIELHIPGYQYCGPGTHLEKRLARGDPGINQLDAACKQHDIAYSKSNDLLKRYEADKILEQKSWERVMSKNASFGEKTAAWIVTNAMKVKQKLGKGHKKRKSKSNKKKNRIKKSRTIPVPKTGGVLPALVPLLLPLIGKALISGAVSSAAAYGTKKILGGGLYLKPYKNGRGVSLKNCQKGR